MPYKKYGKNECGLRWLPLIDGNGSENEIFLINFKPNSFSKLHIHNGSEEIFVLDGELIDADGKLFRREILLDLSLGQSIHLIQKIVVLFLLLYLGE